MGNEEKNATDHVLLFACHTCMNFTTRLNYKFQRQKLFLSTLSYLPFSMIYSPTNICHNVTHQHSCYMISTTRWQNPAEKKTALNSDISSKPKPIGRSAERGWQVAVWSGCVWGIGLSSHCSVVGIRLGCRTLLMSKTQPPRRPPRFNGSATRSATRE